MEKYVKIYIIVLLTVLVGQSAQAQKTVAGCETVTGTQTELATSFTVTATGNFINQGTVNFTGVTTLTNDGGISESFTGGSCDANYNDPCANAAGTSGTNIFDNTQMSTTLQGDNPIRMFDVEIDRDIQLDNEWQVVNNFTFMSGIVTTDRNDLTHFLHFLDGASPNGNSDAAHVNGYVAYTGNGDFTLPTGDGSKELSVGIAGDCASTFAAAYFSGDPGSATLPAGAPFSTMNFNSDLAQVSMVEYWDVNGSSTTPITLAFDANSLAGLSTTDLNDIVIAGWDGSQWVNLGNTAFTGTAASGGTITSSAVVPDNFTAFTFAAILRIDIIVEAVDEFDVCKSNAAIDLASLNASIVPDDIGGTWSSPDGTGDFQDDDGNAATAFDGADKATQYVLSEADKDNGAIILTLTSNTVGVNGPVSKNILVNILQVNCGTFPWSGND